jgi:hypothetical protein
LVLPCATSGSRHHHGGLLGRRQQRNDGVTEIRKIPNRGHSLTIDSGWHEVAETALQFVKRFVEP